VRVWLFCCFILSDADRRDRYSFPTRRSSDLNACESSPRHSASGVASRWVSRSIGAVRRNRGWCIGDAVGRQARIVHVAAALRARSEEHTSALQSPDHLVCRLLPEKTNKSCEY